MSDGRTGKAKVMVVDDLEINRMILAEVLSETYEVELAEDGMEAISIMLNAIVKPDILLLDIMMPGMDGFEVLAYMKRDPLLQKIPVMFITAADEEVRGLQAGAVDYISKPFEPEIIKLRVKTQVELYLYREHLEEVVEQKAEELVYVKEHFLETMADLIEYRSLESGNHVKHTMGLANILIVQLIKKGRYAQELISGNYALLVKAVALHDIGKIGIPDSILLKPGKLTPEEFGVIETHTTIGADVIKSLESGIDDEYLKHCYDICRSHHERWDGNGYPDKLAGEDIPLSARIVAVVDVYDALVSERCYKKAMPHEKAMSILKEEAGKHFDPEVVDVAFEVEEEFKNYKNHLVGC